MLWYYPFCLVWQAYINGNWDIYSRFNYRGRFWSRMIPVATTSVNEMNPSVAYDSARGRWWCAFQKTDTLNEINVFVSYGDSVNGWSAPIRASAVDLRNDKEPVIICDSNNLVWVAWLAPYGEGMNIHTRYYDGLNWSPVLPATWDSNQSNINHDFSLRRRKPFLVWEKSNNIYFSEYYLGRWSSPTAITNDIYVDARPRIISGEPYKGVWVVWYNNRHGNFEISRTEYDLMPSYYRLTTHDSSDFNPTGVNFGSTSKFDPFTILWTSCRNGNKDIYSCYFFSTFPTPVDTNPAEDDSAVVSMNFDGVFFYTWAIWQTNRNGDWDIYGSYNSFYLNIEAETKSMPELAEVKISPNPSRNTIAIDYSLKDASEIRMKLYDASGRIVQRRYEGRREKGRHSLLIGDGLSAGIYFVSLEIDGKRITTKVVITE